MVNDLKMSPGEKRPGQEQASLRSVWAQDGPLALGGFAACWLCWAMIHSYHGEEKSAIKDQT